MLKSDEMRQEFKALVAQFNEAKENQDFELAKELSKQIKDKKEEINLQASVEESERELKKGGRREMSVTASRIKNERKILNSLVCKTILNKPLGEEEKSLAAEINNNIGTPAVVEGVEERGGVLVPVEMLDYHELRNQYTDLRRYVEVLNTSTMSGWIPASYYSGSASYSDALINFDEYSAITEDDLQFQKLSFNVKSFGLLIPISNQMMQDTTVDIMGIVTRNFVRRQVMMENAKIIAALDKALDEDAPTVAPTDAFTAIKKAYNQDLYRQYGLNSIIITNQDGLQVLDAAVDNEGRFILQPMVTDETRLQIGGHEVVVLDNAALPTDATTSTDTGTGKGIPLYVVDLFDFMAIVDRMTLDIAADASAGFTKYSVMVRAVARLDFVTKDNAAGKKIYIKDSTVVTGE